MECERKEAIRAESFKATVFADCKRCGAATVVINKGLIAVLKVFFNFCNQIITEVAVFSEIIARFKIDDLNFRGDGGVFGFFFDGNKGIMGLGKVIILDFRGSGTENALYITSFCDKAGETESRIFRSLILKIG